MRIRNFEYDRTEITASLITGNYLWLAFEGSGGSCTLLKVSAFNPEQVFYTITVPVDKINKIKLSGDYIYLAVEDDTYIGAVYKITNPLTVYYYLTQPSGLVEQKSYDIVKATSNIFVLIPGELSGENAKVLRYNTSYIYQETIDLIKSGDEIVNARTMDIDDNENLWIATYTNPAKLVRVYESGGSYEFKSWEIV